MLRFSVPGPFSVSGAGTRATVAFMLHSGWVLPQSNEGSINEVVAYRADGTNGFFAFQLPALP